MTDAPAKAGERGKPILFSAPMVRALLAGAKTQTRRIIKPRGNAPSLFDGTWSDSYVLNPGNASWRERDVRIQPGDRLWVRESLAVASNDQGVRWLSYAADGKDVWPLSQWTKERNSVPSIHMPRWASRLTLIVTDVRVQRLQDISEEDARAEGLSPRQDGWFAVIDERRGLTGAAPDARAAYALLWNTINGAGSWAANPWVAAYTFTVHHQNIDALPLPAARDAAMKEGA